MNLLQLEQNIKNIVKSLNKETFIYDLLEAYYLPKASLSRLQKGNLNLSKNPGEISWKKKLLFKEEFNRDLHLSITELKAEAKQNQRFVIVTNYEQFLAIDSLTQDSLDISLSDLPKYYDFFLPWAGIEKATHAAENPADVRAAEKMARLFDEIKKDNPDTSPDFVRSLNIFFARILFCYFAEDTNIFEDDQFSHALQSHTKADGSDLDAYLSRLFWVLNTPKEARGDIPNYLDAFPYVNGGLFRETILTPIFSAKSRKLLIDSGDNNDWSSINPDIFGSMFQAVISPEHRGGLGAHYTSVPNIMKVIEPLFLNELKEAFEDAHGNSKKLKELLHRISKIKLFDPACGSGNFLIIAYKELRRLEMQILKELGGFAFSGIHLNNFYGIELDDFAHEIAKLSLWLAEHQMNVEFFNEFGRTNPTLPLQEAGQIVCGNACRLDWEKVCPKNEGDEIYILGNPPYIGFSLQNSDQKNDMLSFFNGTTKLDYIACWFINASKYISDFNAKFSFVSTNSICQGEQTELLWPNIIKRNQEICFAHTSFKWVNNAKANAAVIVIIVGVRNISNAPKFLFIDNIKIESSNINAYLANSSNIIVKKRSSPLSDFEEMFLGNMAKDGGHLFLTSNEKEALLSQFPESERFIRKAVGSNEFINNLSQFCIWLDDFTYKSAMDISIIKDRIGKVQQMRSSSVKGATEEFAKKPYRFVEIRHQEYDAIIFPRVSSERREYIPIGVVQKGTIIKDSAYGIYQFHLSRFSILCSRMHMVWIKAVAGRLKNDYRYSSSLVYNTFAFPPISSQRKEELTHCTFRILEEREKHPEKTLAQLYDPDKMPAGLQEAHRLNDEAVERCYRSTPFSSDEERLEYLFKLYEKMIAEEKEKGTLFEGEKKPRKKK